MEQTLNQLRELLLGSIPTIILFAITYLAYRVIVHGALVRVLAERRSRTQGAIEKAQKDISAAEAKTAHYEKQLRDARLQIYKQQEVHRHRWIEERSTMMQQARAEADSRIKAARQIVQKDIETAKTEIQKSSEALAQEVVRSVLKTRQPVGAER